MSKRLPFRTALAGLTALAILSPTIAPANNTILSAAVAQAQTAPSIAGPNTVNINTPGSFNVNVDAPAGGSIQFYLDGVPLDGPVKLGNGAAQTVTKAITPTSYSNTANPHVVTARYFDAEGYTTRADAVKNFQTPLDLTKLMAQGPGRNDGNTVYNSSVNGQQRNTSNALEVAPNQQITLDASVSGLGNTFTWTDVYELGINPPAGATFVSGKRTDNLNTMLLTRGNGTGGYDRVPNRLSGVEWPSWGADGYPAVNAGYFGIQRTDNYRERSTPPNVQGVFKAPTTPGIYVPQFAQFKYANGTNHYLRPMENAVFRVKPQDLPPLNPRPGAQPIGTTVALAPNQELTAGQAGPLTVTVTPGTKGTITLKADGKMIGSTTNIPADGNVTVENVKIDKAGSTKVAVTFTPAAGSIFASSNGDGTVNVKATTTTTYTGDKTGTKSVPVKLAATVTPNTASGTVTFTQRGTVLAADVPVRNGIAEVEHNFTQASTYPVIAEFKPAQNSNAVGSKSNSVDVVIKDTSSVELTLSPSNVVAGSPVKLTAATGPQLATRGTVQFYDGDTAIGNPMAIQNRSASTNYTPQETGLRTIRAVFTPEGNYNASEDSKQLEVTKKEEPQQPPAPEATAPTLTVTAPTGEKTTADNITLTAKVDPASAGTVEFFNGATSLGTASVTNGTAALTKPLAEGEYTVTAKFTPAANNTTALQATSGPAPKFTVKKKADNQQPPAPEATKTELTLNAREDAKAGDTVTITATTEPADAEGTIEFFNGTQSLGKEQVTNGTATGTFTPETAGSYDIKAVFTPADSTKFAATEQTTTVTVAAVTPPATDGTVPTVDTATPAQGRVDGITALTARVEPGTKGSIKFTLTDGTEIGAAKINSDGTATFNYPFREPGTYSVQARYVTPEGVVSTEASDVFTVTVAEKPKSSITEGSNSSEKLASSEGSSTGEQSSLQGPNRPWIITGITLAVTALVAGLGFFFLNNPDIKNFLAQFGIRY
ncbi:Ig-like domain-containing protein [Corynebacterium urinipleomorphum]|uniref:Ig-like domain-containing protein n=1 Tax=Corynebacterium urinipleomorphum TaxID=1852380 RepID=UPI000B35C8ED|nr:Ig-like domain-containing protein [Corynebacterium urinipleomorphum]